MPYLRKQQTHFKNTEKLKFNEKQNHNKNKPPRNEAVKPLAYPQ